MMLPVPSISWSVCVSVSVHFIVAKQLIASGVVGQLGPSIRQVDEVEIAPQKWAILGMNVGSAIVTTGGICCIVG